MLSRLIAPLSALLLCGCGAGYVQKLSTDQPPALSIEFTGYGVRDDEAVFKVDQVELVDAHRGVVVWETLPLKELVYTPGEEFLLTAGASVGDAVTLPPEFAMEPGRAYYYLAHVAVGPRMELHWIATDAFVYQPPEQ